MDGATYAVRLRDLEQRIDELKEQIRRSHTRLSLLTDTILSGGVAGSRAEIRFKNELSSAFRLTRALFVLDGAVQYNKSDETGALAEQTEIPIFSGSMPPGRSHAPGAAATSRATATACSRTCAATTSRSRSSHSFTAVEGKTLNLAGHRLREGRRHHAARGAARRPLRREGREPASRPTAAAQPGAAPPLRARLARPASRRGFSVGTGGK